MEAGPAGLREDDEDFLPGAPDVEGPAGSYGDPDGFPGLQLGVPGEEIFALGSVSLLPSGQFNGVVAVPGRIDGFGGHFAGQAGHAGSAIVGRVAFAGVAVGGGLVP
eukprot:12262142-Heterocapsa_arctica.AAC.1